MTAPLEEDEGDRGVISLERQVKWGAAGLIHIINGDTVEHQALDSIKVTRFHGWRQGQEEEEEEEEEMGNGSKFFHLGKGQGFSFFSFSFSHFFLTSMNGSPLAGWHVEQFIHIHFLGSMGVKGD